MTQARPLLWWTQAQLDGMAALLAVPWAGWLRDWRGQAAPAGTVECRLTQDAGGHPVAWCPLAAADGAAAWMEDAAPVALFGGEAGAAAGSLALELEKKARDALAGELALALGLAWQPGANGPAAPEPAGWSGDVLAVLSAPGVSLRLLINGACAAKAIGGRTGEPSPAKLPPVVEGVSLLPVRARVELSACVIDLGNLQAVQVGDILRLPHALDQPMQVTLGRQPVCAAYLGRRGESRAVELLRASP